MNKLRIKRVLKKSRVRHEPPEGTIASPFSLSAIVTSSCTLEQKQKARLKIVFLGAGQYMVFYFKRGIFSGFGKKVCQSNAASTTNYGSIYVLYTLKSPA